LLDGGDKDAFYLPYSTMTYFPYDIDTDVIITDFGYDGTNIG
jgi:hypothetical protein